MPIDLALSTCPNDTFLIHGLASGAVDPQGLDIRLHFGDVQELNEGLRAGRFDVSKASYALAFSLGPKLRVLKVGSALGFGVGPVLLARQDWLPEESQPRLLGPGADTTAALLLRALHPEWKNVDQVIFSEIMPALCAGRADLGVCIHEGRFTYADQGLSLVEDLGATFESLTQSPLALGGLFARADLPEATHLKLESVLGASLRYGMEHPAECVPTMARYAQEMSPEVMQQHVDLYVNEWTLELGSVGARAIRALWDLAQTAGALPTGAQPPLIP